MTEFNRETVRAVLEELVAEKGADYVYKPPEYALGCVYQADGQPSCLVGNVVYRLDPQKFEQLAELEKTADDTSWVSVADDLGLGDDDDLTVALNWAQEIQDRGGSWGVALQRFTEALAEPKVEYDEEAEDNE